MAIGDARSRDVSRIFLAVTLTTLPLLRQSLAQSVGALYTRNDGQADSEPPARLQPQRQVPGSYLPRAELGFRAYQSSPVHSPLLRGDDPRYQEAYVRRYGARGRRALSHAEPAQGDPQGAPIGRS